MSTNPSSSSRTSIANCDFHVAVLIFVVFDLSSSGFLTWLKSPPIITYVFPIFPAALQISIKSQENLNLEHRYYNRAPDTKNICIYRYQPALPVWELTVNINIEIFMN